MSMSAAGLPDDPHVRLTVDQYHQLIDLGILTDDDPVELLEGLLYQRAPKQPPHAVSNGLARRAIESLLPQGWFYDSQEPITLADGEPEPDGAVVRGRFQDYAAAHPGPGDVAVVIEIADSSLERDRGIKLRSYARAGIPTYLIINLVERQVELFSEPDPAAQPQPTYRRCEAVRSGTVPIALPGHEVKHVSLDALLPRQ